MTTAVPTLSHGPSVAHTLDHPTYSQDLSTCDLICLASQEGVKGKKMWIRQKCQDCRDSNNTTMTNGVLASMTKTASTPW
jgi:hypothetical protein